MASNGLGVFIVRNLYHSNFPICLRHHPLKYWFIIQVLSVAFLPIKNSTPFINSSTGKTQKFPEANFNLRTLHSCRGGRASFRIDIRKQTRPFNADLPRTWTTKTNMCLASLLDQPVSQMVANMVEGSNDSPC